MKLESNSNIFEIQLFLHELWLCQQCGCYDDTQGALELWTLEQSPATTWVTLSSKTCALKDSRRKIRRTNNVSSQYVKEGTAKCTSSSCVKTLRCDVSEQLNILSVIIN